MFHLGNVILAILPKGHRVNGLCLKGNHGNRLNDWRSRVLDPSGLSLVASIVASMVVQGVASYFPCLIVTVSRAS